jgi:hypothetical protein
MPRKRTPSEKSTDNSTTESATPEAATAVAEPPAAANDNTTAANDNQPSFAERVGQKKRPSASDPFGIATDNVAGVRLFESKQDRQMAIKFNEKPHQPVIDRLIEAGYRWNPVHRIWATPLRPDTAMATRIDAERLYQEIRQMIRAENGIEDGQEVPF